MKHDDMKHEEGRVGFVLRRRGEARRENAKSRKWESLGKFGKFEGGRGMNCVLRLLILIAHRGPPPIGRVVRAGEVFFGRGGVDGVVLLGILREKFLGCRGITRCAGSVSRAHRVDNPASKLAR